MASDGNVTIKNAQQQNELKSIAARTAGDMSNHDRPPNPINIINSRSNINQTNVSSFDVTNTNEMSLRSLQKLSKRFVELIF